MIQLRFIAVLSALVLLSVPAWAGKKVVIVRSSSLSLYENVVQGFKRCIKGADIVGDVTLGGGDVAKNNASLAEVKAKAPDLILALGTNATRVVRDGLPAVPSVFAMVIDPAANKLSPPGVPLDLRAGVQVDFIQKNFSTLKRIGVLYSPGRNLEMVSELKQLQAQGAAIIMVEVPSIEKLDASVSSLVGKADCLLMLTDPIIYSPQTAPQLILQTLQQGLPIIAVSPAYVKAGALAGIYSNPDENGCMAAAVVGRILAGERAASIPFSWPEKYSMAVNLVVAERLGVKVPAAVTSSAEQVVK